MSLAGIIKEVMSKEVFPELGKKYLYKNNNISEEVFCLSFDRATRTAVCKNESTGLTKSYRTEYLTLLDDKEQPTGNWKQCSELPMDGSVNAVLASCCGKYKVLYFENKNWCYYYNGLPITMSEHQKSIYTWTHIPK